MSAKSEAPMISSRRFLLPSAFGSRHTAAKLRWRSIFRLTIAFGLIAVAESMAQTAASLTEVKKDDPVELSPFVVSGSSDVGYVATNTLAGTRLNTPLSDLGTSISVVTKEFMADIGATDSLSLLSFTLGTEVGGTEGNFAGGGTSGNRPNMDGAMTSPEQNQRVRGLAAAQLARNYFNTIIPFDSYNTQSVTINRGPNALLFGVGSPGGVINNATVQPILGHKSYEAAVRFGPHGTARESFDINQDLVPKRVALRLAAENENINFRQKPAFQKDRRAYLAATAVLFTNENSRILGPTMLRVNGESGEIKSNPPNSLAPNDAMNGWWSLPSPSLKSYTGGTFPAYYTNGNYIPQYTINNYGNKAALSPQTTTGPFGTSYFLQLALLYGSSGAPGAGLGNNVAGTPGRVNWPASSGFAQFNMYNTVSAYASGYLNGWTVPSIQNRNVFDYYDNLYTGNTSYANRDFSAYNFALEQSFWKNHGGIELTYDYQKLRRQNFFPFGGGTDSNMGNQDVMIDVSQYLANGQPNPNLGRPFSRTIGMYQYEYTDFRKTYMATAYAKASGRDFFDSKSWMAFIFGSNTLTGAYSDARDTFKTLTYNFGWDSTAIDARATLGFPLTAYQSLVTLVAYTGPSALNSPTESGVRLSPIDIQIPKDGQTYNLYYYDPKTVSIKSAPFFASRFLNTGNLQQTQLESKVVSLQSYFLGDHLIGLYGYRTDTQKAFTNVDLNNDSDPTTFNTLPSGVWSPAAIALNPAPASVVSGSTKTWSLVGIYPWKLPLGSELRLFVNSSSNFNPVGLRTDASGNVLGAPSGVTREQGFMVSMFHNKISARVNFFETSGKNFTDSNLQSAVNYATGAQVANWASLALQEQLAGVPIANTSYSRGGFTSYDQLYSAIAGLLPEPLRDETNLRVQTVNGFPTVLQNPLKNPVATTDFLAKGWEFELTGNPTQCLRLSVNVAKQATVESNVAPLLAALNSQAVALLQASPLANLPDNLISPDTNTFATRYAGRVTVPLNAIANYTFREGMLRGWEVGTGARWQSKVAIGYPTYVNSAGSQVPNVSAPYWGPAAFNADVWLGYSRKVFHDRARWKIQLNVRNAIGSTSPVPVIAAPDGTVSVVRVPPLPEVYLTNTIKF
jgi:hypothetical protein